MPVVAGMRRWDVGGNKCGRAHWPLLGCMQSLGCGRAHMGDSRREQVETVAKITNRRNGLSTDIHSLSAGSQ